MKVLWLSMTSGLYNANNSAGGYNGGGWISSLQGIVNNKIELSLCFITNNQSDKFCKRGNTSYYPIFIPDLSCLQKIKLYYGGYKHSEFSLLINQIKIIISSCNPEVIHLFGLENPLACVLGQTDIPIIVHLQGLLGPYDNAFFPQEMNRHSLIWPPTIREWILRNGYIYAKKSIKVRAQQEKGLFRMVQYCMGRTDWDYQVSQLMAPESHYYKVNEVLREPFYENACSWKHRDGKLIITSTVSETVYKGLDLILKAAHLLSIETNIDFEWNVVGINKHSNFVTFFEHNTKISSNKVHIHYLGVMNADELVDNFRHSSVYVHPSYIDNSPNSVCEAQLVGLPVITCNVGGVSTLLDNGNAGILIPSNAPYELAFHLKQFALHRDYCEDKRLSGVKLAKKRHDKSQILTDLLNTYNNVLEQSKTNG